MSVTSIKSSQKLQDPSFQLIHSLYLEDLKITLIQQFMISSSIRTPLLTPDTAKSNYDQYCDASGW